MNDAPFGALAPNPFDRAIMALTGRMPDNWAGLKLAMALRRLVTMRMETAAALDVERWRLRMRLHPRDNGCEKNLLFTPQMYEPPEREELAREIAGVAGRPFVFIDIGANVGLFSLFVAATACTARILAIEPEPGNFARLAFNIAANPGSPITPLALALGETEGTAVIMLKRAIAAAPAWWRAGLGGGVEVRCRPSLRRHGRRAHRHRRPRSTSKAPRTRCWRCLPERAGGAVARSDRDRGFQCRRSSDLFAPLASRATRCRRAPGRT